MFRKRKKPGGAPSPREGSSAKAPEASFYPIPFGRMVKGSILTRRGKQIRQFGLSFRGAVRLITSGDVVDKETYDALVAAGAVMPDTPRPPNDAQPLPPAEEARSILPEPRTKE